MDIGITDFRAHLSHWLEQARDGEEVVVTDRGVPVARLLGVGATATLERLSAAGVIAPGGRPLRPMASGRHRGRARQPVSDLVNQQRR